MGRDPAFLFYDSDAARDVSHMNRLERGCYFDFIQAQRKFHGITIDQARKILGHDFDSCWSALELILSKEKDTYYIEWVRESIKARQEHAEKQRVRIQKYWDEKKKEDIPEQYHGITTEVPLVNEDEDVIEDVIKDKIVIDYDFVVENYHSLCPKLNKVAVMNDLRKGFINARVGEFGMEKVISVIRIAGESDFLNGKNDKAWKADFEWILRPTNFVKIMEGKYKNHTVVDEKKEEYNNLKKIVYGK
jgi:hypothetical protein